MGPIYSLMASWALASSSQEISSAVGIAFSLGPSFPRFRGFLVAIFFFVLRVPWQSAEFYGCLECGTKLLGWTFDGKIWLLSEKPGCAPVSFLPIVFFLFFSWSYWRPQIFREEPSQYDELSYWQTTDLREVWFDLIWLIQLSWSNALWAMQRASRRGYRALLFLKNGLLGC